MVRMVGDENWSSLARNKLKLHFHGIYVIVSYITRGLAAEICEPDIYFQKN